MIKVREYEVDRVKDRSIIVSIVIPVYNEECYIEKCILSLLQQDYRKEQMEWIFIDGGSSDNTVLIIKKYMQKYPELIKLSIILIKQFHML